MLTELEFKLSSLPNPKLLLIPWATREAMLSSKIEGTQTNLKEVLEARAGIEVRPDRFDDIREVRNYEEALSYAKQELIDRPFSKDLLLRLHEVLMSGARGRDKHPGQFRKTQNFIGVYGQSIDEARFVPPSPVQVESAMDNLIAYLKEGTGREDPLGELAIMHGQFEIIHPFEDGNGRMGRILIPIMLHLRGLIGGPHFYMSLYLERHRKGYYDALKSVSDTGKWDGWIAFFLEGICEQAKESRATIDAMLELHTEIKTQYDKIHHLLLDALFYDPIFELNQLVEHTGLPYHQVRRSVEELVSLGWLGIAREGKGRRSYIFIFDKLMEILTEDDI